MGCNLNWSDVTQALTMMLQINHWRFVFKRKLTDIKGQSSFYKLCKFGYEHDSALKVSAVDSWTEPKNQMIWFRPISVPKKQILPRKACDIFSEPD